MRLSRLVLTALLTFSGTHVFADTLTGNGSWQSWSPTVLNTANSGAPTGPYWNGASGDGTDSNIGWCLTGTGNCHIANPPGALAYYGNGTAAASSMYFTASGSAQEVTLLGLFSNQNGALPAGTNYFGWYSITNGTVGPLNPLLSSTEAIGSTATFDPTSTYGLYVENVQSAGTSYTASYYWLTNTDGSYATGTGVIDPGVQHFSIFGSATSSLYYLGVEDTPAPTADFDYNDLVVSLQPVPEPAGFGLITAGIALLGWSIRRRQA